MTRNQDKAAAVIENGLARGHNVKQIMDQLNRSNLIAPAARSVQTKGRLLHHTHDAFTVTGPTTRSTPQMLVLTTTAQPLKTPGALAIPRRDGRDLAAAVLTILNHTDHLD